MEAKYRLTFEGAAHMDVLLNAQRMLALFCVTEVQNVHLKTNLQMERVQKTSSHTTNKKWLTYLAKFFCKSTIHVSDFSDYSGYFRGDWLDFFLVQNIRMLKLYVNFILRAQNHISAQVKFWYYSIFSTLCTTSGMNTSLFFVTFSCTLPEASADFSQCEAIQFNNRSLAPNHPCLASTNKSV